MPFSGSLYLGKLIFMTTEQFRELIQRYKEDRLSQGDWDELRLALAEGTHDETLEDDIQHVFDGETRRLVEATEAPMRNIRVAGRMEKSLAIIRGSWLRWPAAAAVLVLVAGASWLLNMRNKDQKTVIAATPVQAIQPGGNKAWLLLANGERLLLDDAQKGVVASQGGVQVVKLDSGLLAYNRGASGSGEGGYNTVTTPRGGQYQLILSDGTKVWLNAASYLRFPVRFSGEERMVEMSGEAYFEVAHNAARPFRVKAGQHVVEDIGTAFNVNAYSDEPVARTTLIEGSVRVSGQKTFTLHPGQQAQWQKTGKEAVTDGVDPEEVLAWKNGQIAFTNADFQSLMRSVSRWYDVNIHYSGAVPDAHFFGLLNRNVVLPTLLDYFRENGVHIKQEGRDITILP